MNRANSQGRRNGRSSSTTSPRAPAKTIAELIAAVSADKTVAKSTKIDLRCCLNRFAELCGSTAADLPAAPAQIRILCREHIDHAPQISASRAVAIRSALGKALQIYGIGEGRRPHGARLSQSYERLLAQLPTPWDRYPISRFLRYCSQRALPPLSIDNQTFLAFKEYVDHCTLVENPKRVANLTRRAWNNAVRTVRGWPQVHLRDPRARRAETAAPLQSFREEHARYVRFMEGNGPSPSGGIKSKAYRASTIRHRGQLVMQFGTILARKQQPPNSLADLCDPDKAAMILNALRNESGAKLKTVYQRAIFLRHLARVWCAVPTASYNALLDLERKFIPPFRGRAERSARLTKLLFDAERQNALLCLPKVLMNQAQAQRYRGARAALKAQVAAALEVMLTAPLWPANLAGLRLGRTITRERIKRRTIYRISIPRSDVQNDRPLEYVLPPESSALLDNYVAGFRGRLCDSTMPWLFPGRGNKPKQVSAFSRQITSHIRRATGTHLTMSSLRYFVGAIYLLRNPGAHEVVRQALGHKSLQTTHEMYAELDSIEVAHRFDQKVLLHPSRS